MTLTRVDSGREAMDLEVYYQEADPVITRHAHEILVEYSGVPEDQLISHVRRVRDQAWAVFKYPCVGNYYFLEFSISQLEQYLQVLGRLRGGETLLDLGCCFGQDIRKLVHDGAPASSVYGSELEQGFVNLGFELFRDRDRLWTNISAGDFFADDVAGLAGRQFDIIHAASFFHLFSWDDQIEAMSRAVGLLKPKAGSMVFGRQTAVSQAKEVKHPANKRSGNMFRHDMGSLRRMVQEVGERTKTRLEVSLVQQKDWKELDDEYGWHRVSFRIVLTHVTQYVVV